MELRERTLPGLHDEVFSVFSRLVPPGRSVLDCGCGTGAWLSRLRKAGFTRLHGIDLDGEGFALDRSMLTVTSLDGAFAESVGKVDVVTAIEVIEHIESPTNFLREIRRTISSDGVLFLTTPNVECVPARLRFLVNGSVRMFDEKSDPTHITPIFSSVLSRIADRAGWTIERQVPLAAGWPSTRPILGAVCRALALVMAGSKYGDCQLFILHPKTP